MTPVGIGGRSPVRVLAPDPRDAGLKSAGRSLAPHTAGLGAMGAGRLLAAYISSRRVTSRLRNVGGESHRLASCAANAEVSGKSELAIASS